MKMKLIFKSALFIGLVAVVSACYDDPGTDILPWDQAYLELDRAGQGNPTVSSSFLRLNNGTKYPLNVQVNVMGRPRDVATTVNFTIEAASLAVPGVHYNKITSGNSVTIPAGSNSANIQFEVLADNINAGESWSLIINVASPDLPSSQYVRATWNLSVLCPSDYAGTYSFVSTNFVTGPGGNLGACGASRSGTGTMTAVAGAPGAYTLTDATFGAFACLYADTPPGGTLRLNDSCDRLFFTGIDKYGDSYTLTFVSVTPTVLTFDWVNTYGDGSRTALTRTDAKTWKLTLND